MAYSKAKNAELIFRIRFYILSIMAGAGLGGGVGNFFAKYFISADFNNVFFIKFLFKRWVKDQAFFQSLSKNFTTSEVELMHQFADQFQSLIFASASAGAALAAAFCIYLFHDFDKKRGF